MCFLIIVVQIQLAIYLIKIKKFRKKKDSYSKNRIKEGKIFRKRAKIKNKSGNRTLKKAPLATWEKRQHAALKGASYGGALANFISCLSGSRMTEGSLN